MKILIVFLSIPNLRGIIDRSEETALGQVRRDDIVGGATGSRWSESTQQAISQLVRSLEAPLTDATDSGRVTGCLETVPGPKS